MVRKHGKEPYHIVVLHGGPGAAGSAFGLAGLISKEFGVLEPMQSKHTIMELEEELMEQMEENCSGKVILISCAPLDEVYGFTGRKTQKKKYVIRGSGRI